MSVRATSHHPTLLIIYLEIYPNGLQRWLREVEGHQCSHEYLVLSVKSAKCIQRLQQVQFFEVANQ
jgi:hypothetical protein